MIVSLLKTWQRKCKRWLLNVRYVTLVWKNFLRVIGVVNCCCLCLTIILKTLSSYRLSFSLFHQSQIQFLASLRKFLGYKRNVIIVLIISVLQFFLYFNVRNGILCFFIEKFSKISKSNKFFFVKLSVYKKIFVISFTKISIMYFIRFHVNLLELLAFFAVSSDSSVFNRRLSSVKMFFLKIFVVLLNGCLMIFFYSKFIETLQKYNNLDVNILERCLQHNIYNFLLNYQVDYSIYQWKIYYVNLRIFLFYAMSNLLANAQLILLIRFDCFQQQHNKRFFFILRNALITLPKFIIFMIFLYPLLEVLYVVNNLCKNNVKATKLLHSQTVCNSEYVIELRLKNNINLNVEARRYVCKTTRLHIQKNTIYHLIGKNGSGKTNILLAIAGIDSSIYSIKFLLHKVDKPNFYDRVILLNSNVFFICKNTNYLFETFLLFNRQIHVFNERVKLMLRLSTTTSCNSYIQLTVQQILCFLKQKKTHFEYFYCFSKSQKKIVELLRISMVTTAIELVLLDEFYDSFDCKLYNFLRFFLLSVFKKSGIIITASNALSCMNNMIII